MESYAPKDWITEERFYADVHGKFISGAIDAVEPTDTGVNHLGLQGDDILQGSVRDD